MQNGEIENDWQLLLWAPTNKMADKNSTKIETLYLNYIITKQSAKHKFCMGQICYREADANFWNYDARQEKYTRIKNSVCLISNKSRNYFKPCFLLNETKLAERRTLFWRNCSKRHQNAQISYILRPWKFCWFAFS